MKVAMSGDWVPGREEVMIELGSSNSNYCRFFCLFCPFSNVVQSTKTSQSQRSIFLWGSPAMFAVVGGVQGTGTPAHRYMTSTLVRGLDVGDFQQWLLYVLFDSELHQSIKSAVGRTSQLMRHSHHFTNCSSFHILFAPVEAVPNDLDVEADIVAGVHWPGENHPKQ